MGQLSEIPPQYPRLPYNGSSAQSQSTQRLPQYAQQSQLHAPKPQYPQFTGQSQYTPTPQYATPSQQTTPQPHSTPAPKYSPGSSFQTVQPAPLAPMSTGLGGNRNPRNLPYDQNGERDWSNPLIGCYEPVEIWPTACFCPWIAYGTNKSRRDHLRDHGTPHPTGGEVCTTACWTYCLLTHFMAAGWVMQIGSRGRTREQYRIRGTLAEDVAVAVFCAPCGLVQEAGEILLEEQSVCPPVQNAPIPTPNMTMSPNAYPTVTARPPARPATMTPTISMAGHSAPMAYPNTRPATAPLPAQPMVSQATGLVPTPTPGRIAV